VGVDTKSILFGKPNAAEIAQAITEAFGFDPEVRMAFNDDPTYFILNFPDTQDKKEARRLNVHLDCEGDYAHVHQGKATQCSLGMWGGSIEIMEALARKFGGFVCDCDSVGEWRPVDRVENSDAPLAPLPPEAVLNLTLAKVIDPQAALHIRKVVKDSEQFASLMDALDVYRAQTAAAA
jgi:hypothetical protein